MSELVVTLQQPQETAFGRVANRFAGAVANEAKNIFKYGVKAPVHWARYAGKQAGHVGEFVQTGTTTITPQEVMLNAQIAMVTGPYLAAAGMALADNAPHIVSQLADWMHIGGHHPQGPDNHQLNGLALQQPEPTLTPTPQLSVNEILQQRLDNPQCGLTPADYADVVPHRFNLLGEFQQLFGSTTGNETRLFNQVFAEQFACNPGSETAVFDGSGNPINMHHLETIHGCMAKVATFDSDVSQELNLGTESAQSDWLRNVCANITLHDANGEAIMIGEGEAARQKNIYDFIIEAARPAVEAVRQLRADVNAEASNSGGSDSIVARASEGDNAWLVKVFGPLAGLLYPALVSFLGQLADGFLPVRVPRAITHAYLIYPKTIDGLKRLGRWSKNMLPSNNDESV